MVNSNRHVFCWFALVAGCTLILNSVVQAGKPPKPGGNGSGANYRLIQLPDASGSVNLNGYALDISNQKVIGGAIQGRAYCWQLDGQGNIAEIVPLAWPSDERIDRTEAWAVNEIGTVVGYGGQWFQSAIPLVWLDPLVANVAPLELPLLSTDAEGNPFIGTGIATDVNRHGMITGWLRDADPNGYDYVVVWKVNLDSLDALFGTVEAGPQVIATGQRYSIAVTNPDGSPGLVEKQSGIRAPFINDNGNVVATVDVGSPPTPVPSEPFTIPTEHLAWRWKVSFDPEMKSLDVIESQLLLPAFGHVNDINEHDEICGAYYTENGAARAYLQDADGEFHQLPDLVDNKRHGTTNHSAYALNDGDGSGLASVQVVGAGLVYDKRGIGVISHHQLMWQGTNAVDVGAGTDFAGTSLELSYFSDVNNDGWIVPWASAFGQVRAVVLIPLQ